MTHPLFLAASLVAPTARPHHLLRARPFFTPNKATPAAFDAPGGLTGGVNSDARRG